MCGIAGIVSEQSVPNLERNVNNMIEVLQNRGPDDFGVWTGCEHKVSIGHRRLSILDASIAGHQPMISPSGRFVIVFNGEIYNHSDLRKRLNSHDNNILWKGHSDTETLLSCFDNLGVVETLKSTVGMFAFALWDIKKQKLILSVDRFGEKPLYYGYHAGMLVFASELKAIRTLPGFSVNIDLDALSIYLRKLCVPKPKCILNDFVKMPAGSWIEISFESIKKKIFPKPKQYWSALEQAMIGEKDLLVFESEKEAVDQLDFLLKQSIRGQMLSDVPVGAFLSGGIDSSTIAAVMQSESNSPIETFSIGFNEMGYNEAQYANQVAKHLKTNHTEVYLDSKDALSIIPNLPEIYDEPFADSSQIPTFLLSKITKRKVTVALSGDGGDEIFGGYNRYFIAGGLWKQMALLPTPVRNIISSSIHSISPSSWDRIYSLIKSLIPKNRRIELIGDKLYKSASILTCDNESKLYDRLTQLSYPPDFVLGERYINKFDIKSYTSQNPVAQMMILDTLGYLSDDILTKVDRAAMANSLESRMPLLDHRIFEFAWKLPHNYKIRNGTGKWLLRQLLYRYVPKNLVERPKMGFGIPVDDWLRGPLKEWSGDLLATSRLKEEGYFNTKYVQKMWDEHQAKKRNWGSNLWAVLMFEAWLKNVKK